MKRVLVTGASGFIGRHCLAPLLARGFEVHAVGSSPAGLADCVRWHRADLRDWAATEALLQTVRPSHLLHLAWDVEPGRFWSAPQNFAWVAASMRLLEAFSAAGGRRVVGAGSCAEYDWRDGHCSERTTPLVPHSFYGRCKHALQQLADEWCAMQGLSWGWGRIFLLYGPYEDSRRFVPSVARALLRGEPARCTHGQQLRDFLHVADVADAFVALLDSAVEGAVNIASGEPRRVGEVAALLAQQSGRSDLLQLGSLAAPPDDPPRITADVLRLHRELGWRPRYDLALGLQTTLNWWRDQVPHDLETPGAPS